MVESLQSQLQWPPRPNQDHTVQRERATTVVQRKIAVPVDVAVEERSVDAQRRDVSSADYEEPAVARMVDDGHVTIKEESLSTRIELSGEDSAKLSRRGAQRRRAQLLLQRARKGDDPQVRHSPTNRVRQRLPSFEVSAITSGRQRIGFTLGLRSAAWDTKAAASSSPSRPTGSLPLS